MTAAAGIDQMARLRGQFARRCHPKPPLAELLLLQKFYSILYLIIL
jgi:hypothetical protein